MAKFSTESVVYCKISAVALFSAESVVHCKCSAVALFSAESVVHCESSARLCLVQRAGFSVVQKAKLQLNYSHLQLLTPLTPLSLSLSLSLSLTHTHTHTSTNTQKCILTRKGKAATPGGLFAVCACCC